jgi:hypothetical protein
VVVEVAPVPAIVPPVARITTLGKLGFDGLGGGLGDAAGVGVGDWAISGVAVGVVLKVVVEVTAGFAGFAPRVGTAKINGEGEFAITGIMVKMPMVSTVKRAGMKSFFLIKKYPEVRLVCQ